MTGTGPERTKPAGARAAAWLRSHAVLAGLVGLCALIELALEAADLGLWASPQLRGLAYQNGGFWIGLLVNWRSNYPLQPVAMFVTYGFLHGGFWHMGLNMVTLVSLGQPVVARLGQGRFLALYGAAMLGGGAGYALLSATYQPMVGASGALFGLAGALIWWDYADRRAAGIDRRSALIGLAVPVLGLILLNVAMYWAMNGQLAWSTHLGGFVVGAGMAMLFGRRRPAAG